ncbi:MAG: DNA replication and repair protein RecF [Oscillospiraceae bacterium]|jgi:DNA replication and repair protein RecF|nr:DNA replication and repair protein RecF [Oscillospiraceae bacterium]
MHILRFAAARFRNLGEAVLEPCPGVNVIYGENGQGKTNLIEGIWLFTGCRSFRTAENAELLLRGSARAELSAVFESNAREQRAELCIAKRRVLRLNGFEEETPRRLLGVFPAVAFTPATLALVQGGPGERRRFLDVALSMLRPAYAVRLSKYLKALAQRNALLRQAPPDSTAATEALLLPWDATLAHEAAALATARRQYLAELIPQAQAFYEGISHARETLALAYQPAGLRPEEWAQGDAAELEARYLAAYRQNRRGDFHRQMTHAGPHRDDLLLTLDGANLRGFGSQGQQRTAALALKLAEAAVLREQAEECPVTLLDDVMSELDAHRQADLLRYLEGWQVFLTCCEPGHLLHGRCGKAFEVKAGQVAAMGD